MPSQLSPQKSLVECGLGCQLGCHQPGSNQAASFVLGLLCPFAVAGGSDPIRWRRAAGNATPLSPAVQSPFASSNYQSSNSSHSVGLAGGLGRGPKPRCCRRRSVVRRCSKAGSAWINTARNQSCRRLATSYRSWLARFLRSPILSCISYVGSPSQPGTSTPGT